MDNGNDNYITEDGLRKLQEELEYLVHVRRPEVARQIADAKADGDVSENAGYDEAKTAQAFLEGKIMTLKNIISSAVVIHENGSKDLVDLGCKVTIRDVEYGDEETYTIVGSTEVDPVNGRISLKSPIGRALMGHRKGELIDVQSPGGSVQFEIVKIQ